MIALGLVALFVFLNGFFVAAEFALVKLRQTQARELAETHGWRGRVLLRVHRQLDAYLSACQLGITLASLGLGKKAPFLAATWVGVFLLFHALSYFTGRIHDRFDRTPRWALPFAYATLAAIFFWFWPTTNAAFIYFQF